MPTAASVTSLVPPPELAEPGTAKCHLVDSSGATLIVKSSTWYYALRCASVFAGWILAGTDAPATRPNESMNADPTLTPAGHYDPCGQRMTGPDAHALGAAIRRLLEVLPGLDPFDGCQERLFVLPLKLTRRMSERGALVRLITPARSVGVAAPAVGGRLAEWLAQAEGDVRLMPGVPPLLPSF